jgi:hypothetical protein
MTDSKIDPVDDENQQRKAEHEAKERDDSPIEVIEDAVGTIVRPLTKERLTAEEAEEQREETDKEERSS